MTKHLLNFGKKISPLVTALVFASSCQFMTAQNAFADATQAYIGNFKDNTISVINTGTNKVAATISVPTGPEGLAITPDNRFVYVCDSGAASITAIDTTTNKAITHITVGENPQGMDITKDGKLIVAAIQGVNTVAFIDVASNKVISQLPIPTVHNIVLSPDNKIAYAGSQQPGKFALVIVDMAKKAVTGSIPLSNAPRALQFSADGKYVYFTAAGVSAIEVVDTASQKVVAEIPVGASPHAITFTHDGKVGLTASQGAGLLYLFDPTSNKITSTITVGNQPHWIAVSSDDKTAYVTNEKSNNVSVVDLANKKVITTITVGNAPRKIVVQQGPSQSASTAANSTSNVVSISNFDFLPKTITVKSGQTITWKNNDAVTHRLGSNDQLIVSQDLDPGQSYSKTFTKPGTFNYICSIHRYMIGKVVVS